jgi:DNA-binding response OmpR family regulator
MDAHHNTRRANPDHRVIGPCRESEPSADTESPLRVLVVSGRIRWAARVREALGLAGAVCDLAGTLGDACGALNDPAPKQGMGSSGVQGPLGGNGIAGPRESEIDRRVRYDAVVTDCALPDGDGFVLAERAHTRQTPVILVAKRATIDLAACVMEHGAVDLIEHATPVDSDLARRILVLAERSRNRRVARSGQSRRLFRLRSAQASDIRHLAQQTRASDSDLLQAHPELAEHMKNVTTVSEFKGLIRGELDIEQLLRTTLEFILARSGPTNAAVFLPTTSGDYSLGAYVNYDCPKETCDVLLDHLANAVAPRFENVRGMAHLTTPEQLDEYLDKDADWLHDSHVVGFPCLHGEECLAIFMLFRDQRSPFQQPLLEQVRTVGELFATQLARVIHIHHRHLPKNKWGMIGDPPAETDEFGDLAA